MEEETLDRNALWGVVGFAIFVAVAIVASMVFVMRYRSRYLLNREEVKSFFQGNTIQQNESENGTVFAMNAKYDKAKYEILEADFTVGKGLCRLYMNFYTKMGRNPIPKLLVNRYQFILNIFF